MIFGDTKASLILTPLLGSDFAVRQPTMKASGSLAECIAGFPVWYARNS
jgi:hypothetical protein